MRLPSGRDIKITGFTIIPEANDEESNYNNLNNKWEVKHRNCQTTQHIEWIFKRIIN
jgi:hypothetical protein